MKITGLKATPVAVPMKSDDSYMHVGPNVTTAVLLEVFTDEGITGIAEVPVVVGAEISKQLVMNAEKFVVGKDPCMPTVLLKELYALYNLNHLHMMVANWAVNSIERACWDIMGKKAGLPLYKLWGGNFRREVPVFFWSTSTDLDEVRQEAKVRAAQGYKVLYTKVGFDTVEYDIEMVKAIREGAPDPSVKIRVDANQAWTVGDAIRAINGMEPYGMDCVDQPVMQYNLDALKAVKERTRVPIAAHEASWTMFDMLRVISQNAADIVHIDPRFDGGYHGARVSAGIAEAANVPVISHAYYELGVAIMERMHCCASFPAYTMVNQLGEYEQMSDDIIKGGKIEVVNGHIRMPDRPGLGVELDEERVARYNEVYVKEVLEPGFDNATESPLYGAQFTRNYMKPLYAQV